jgi:hypothetical protein
MNGKPNMKINKHIERAIKEINFAIEWETKEKQDLEIDFWLQQMYLQGRIDAFKESIEIHNK